MRTIGFTYRSARRGRRLEKTRNHVWTACYVVYGAVVALLPLGRALGQDSRIIPVQSSTVPANGDQNPYGVAFVPGDFLPGGPLHPGDILVSNFNNAGSAPTGNLQGTGTTIVKVAPNGQQSLFFQGNPQGNPPPTLGLTTALGVLEGSFVLVGLANNWTKVSVPEQTDSPQMWFAGNAATSPTLTITPKVGSQMTLLFFDVVGAATSPLDTTATVPSVGVDNTNNSNLLGMPVVTTSTPGELVMAVMNDGVGPAVGMVASGFVLDSCTYTGEVDADFMDNADGYAHYVAPAAGQVSFGWIMDSSSLPEWSQATAVCFKALGN